VCRALADGLQSYDSVRRASVRVGCSGWQYGHWRGRFYPRDLPVDRWLEYYAERFDTLELNNSFYRLPEAAQFDAWRERLPSRFVLAVKASRYLTHLKRLRDAAEPLHRLWSRADRLRDRLGPMLYQLPPRWHRDVERLTSFVGLLPPRRRHAFEFRDASWYEDTVFRVLVDGNAALCLHDMPGSASPVSPIGPFVYVRFHGSGARYGGAYSPQRLTAWAERLAAWADAGVPAYVYFNNDAAAHAIHDAYRLRELLGRRGVA
jgi:uncharacterized protein YecE (DUF72 family)